MLATYGDSDWFIVNDRHNVMRNLSPTSAIQDAFPKKSSYFTHQRLPHWVKNMTLRSGKFSAFDPVNVQGCGLNSPFSIRRILNLPEESTEECVPSSPTENVPSVLPLVHRVVCPTVHNPGSNVSCTSLKSWQDFGMPYTYLWGNGTLPFRNQIFQPGI